MAVELAPWLETLENTIDLDWEREKFERWRRVLDFQPVDGAFRVAATAAGGREPGDWPRVSVNQAIADPALMLLQQLRPVYEAACRRSHAALNIRCNYGTGILPSLFGAELFWMDEQLDTLPTTRPLEGEDAIDRLLDSGVPPLENGLGGRVFETAEFFMEALAPYPGIREAVWLYHPDLQGPIDVVELLWGSGMYYAFYEEPEKLKALTALVTETYIRFLRRWLELVKPRAGGEYMAHWGCFFKGQVMLRDDTVVNLSPEMYAEFVRPHDERILEEFGAGAIHFCGKADHLVELMTASPRLTALNLSQPELNDMRKVYRATVERGIVLNCPWREEALAGLDLSRGVVLD